MKGRELALLFIVLVTTTLAGCGTLTGIPSYGGGKRFAIEQQLVSTTIRGAHKKIDLSVLRDKTVFIQMTAANDLKGGGITGGRGNLLFAYRA